MSADGTRGGDDGWTGDDRTQAGTPQHPTGWTGDDRTIPGAAPAGWTGEDRTLAGGQPAAAPAGWTGADATDPGAAMPAVAGQTPAPGTWVPEAAASRTASSAASPRRSGSDRLLAVGDAAAHQRLAEEMRRSDDPWLSQGKRGELTGRVLGDFLVGGMLGEGGMAVVYRARQVSLGRPVALKTLPHALADDPILVERFAVEARSASSVVSPHVVQVHFAGSVDGEIFYAMEYVEGSDLARVLAVHRQAGTLPSHGDALRWTAQAARGLAAAAAHGIVHRDIKPQNLLLAPDGALKIADFGIAKILGESGLTVAGATIGTPAYCSPEQGRGAEVDPRSDLYSLGVVLYELLTGRKPFEAALPDAMVYQHNFAEPKAPRELVPALPQDCEAACMRLLMKDPAQRYQSATDLADDLERMLAGVAVEIPPYVPKFGTGADEALRRYGGGRRRLWYALGAAALVLLALASAWWWRAEDSQSAELDRRRTALAPLDRTEPAPRSAAADLAWVSAAVGADDADVRRWSAKLGRLAALRTRLAALDADGLPGAALRASAAADLNAWAAECGSEDPDLRRWTDRLAAATTEDRRLAVELAALDRGAPSAALAERLAPLLAARAPLVAADEPDQQRWSAAIAAVAGRSAHLRARLQALDGEALLRHGQLRELAVALADWRILHGDDPEARRWDAALAARTAVLEDLRGRLSRLDRVELPTLPLQLELAEALAAHAVVADPGDPEQARWEARMAAGAARIAALREALGAQLDGAAPPDAGAIEAVRRLLAEYRALVSGDDGRLLAWERRLAAEEAELARLHAAIAPVLRPGRIGGPALTAAQTALPALVARGGLGEAAAATATARLAEEEAHRAGLRQALAGPYAAGQIPIARELAELAGADDPSVAAWRVRAEAVERAQGVLAGLDRTEPPPEGAEAALAALRAEIGETAEVQRWSAKLQRIAVLRAALAPLGERAPSPPDAAAMLDELAVRWTGPDDPLVRRGRERLAMAAAFRNIIGTALSGPPVLPVASLAPGAIDALIDLEGEAAPGVAAWRTRLAQLRPAPPAWATSAGLDAHGPWAELPLGEARLRFRWLPPGPGVVGSPPDEAGRDADEERRRVELARGVWMLEGETTQRMWVAAGMTDRSRFRGADLPVDSVSRTDAEAFCRAVAAAAASATVRLPDETEWELACRAGSTGPYAVDAAALAQVAAFGSTDGTSPAALRDANALGLRDMHGNLWEWVGGGPGVVRGGSWMDRPALLRSANRVAIDPAARLRTVGFRIVIEP
jgi:hypothetical protein